jgi:hypothetical protein
MRKTSKFYSGKTISQVISQNPNVLSSILFAGSKGVKGKARILFVKCYKDMESSPSFKKYFFSLESRDFKHVEIEFTTRRIISLTILSESQLQLSNEDD